MRDAVQHDTSRPSEHARAAQNTTQGADNFDKDVQKVRAQIQSTYSNLIHPYGRFMQRWDLTMTVALLITTFVTPFEVGLNLATKIDALFLMNQVWDSGALSRRCRHH